MGEDELEALFAQALESTSRKVRVPRPAPPEDDFDLDDLNIGDEDSIHIHIDETEDVREDIARLFGSTATDPGIDDGDLVLPALGAFDDELDDDLPEADEILATLDGLEPVAPPQEDEEDFDELDRERAGEHEQTGLGHAVVGESRSRSVAADVTDVDHHAAARQVARLESREQGLGEQGGCPAVDGLHPVPCGCSQLREGYGRIERGIVDEHVDGPRPVGQRRTAREGAKVGLHKNAACCVGFADLSRALHPSGRSVVVQHEVEAGLRKCDRDGLTEAHPGAGDQGSGSGRRL